jgi:Na+-transporting methylmalonyl-CoA/oxaloacetate decarboxylase gamma subunit
MNDLGSGAFLMCVGMGTVFLFLVLLIGITEAIRMAVGTPAAPSAPPAAAADDALEAAVIAAAVTHDRARRKRRR